MARRLRVQFPGARYHVINRGNFQHPVFASSGATHAFENALGEACQRYRWRVHAYVVLSNHFHVALETPEPNLVDGMHWLQTSFATRHNRFHGRHGHLFQGRYKSLLIQDAAYLARVVDYIHLNPVRAGLVPADRISEYPSSSLWRFLQPDPPAWLVASEFLSANEAGGSAHPWPDHLARLVAVASDPRDDDRMCRGALSAGWAIGTAGWRNALGREYANTVLVPDLAGDELSDLKRSLWQRELEAGLSELGKTLSDAERDLKGAQWKVSLALRLRTAANAPHRWIAETLKMGAVSSVRAYLSQTSV
ncbi:MAG: transposase [Verrucomicrobia bacterium]|nr:transposase [Verrucomicrobiota bacterium]